VTLGDILDLARSHGYEVEQLERTEWVERLDQLASAKEGTPYAALFPEMGIASIPTSESGLLDDRQLRAFLDSLPSDDSSLSLPRESWDAGGLFEALANLGFFPSPRLETPPTAPVATG